MISNWRSNVATTIAVLTMMKVCDRTKYQQLCVACYKIEIYLFTTDKLEVRISAGVTTGELLKLFLEKNVCFKTNVIAQNFTYGGVLATGSHVRHIVMYIQMVHMVDIYCRLHIARCSLKFNMVMLYTDYIKWQTSSRGADAALGAPHQPPYYKTYSYATEYMHPIAHCSIIN